MLFEVYTDYAPVRERANALWRGLTGVLASSLLLLCLLLTPVLWRLMGRLQSAQRSREVLLRRAVDTSLDERRRIAANLHDGPVQELVATSYAVSGAADKASAADQPGLANVLREAAGTVRTSIVGLRTLLVDIYPASLSSAGLASAIGDLTTPLVRRGLDVSVELDPSVIDHLDTEAERLVYRVTQECLRNVVKHSDAGTVDLRLTPVGDGYATLEIVDDGVGFDVAETLTHPEAGHLGISVIIDLATSGGASLRVLSGPAAGTRWELTFAIRIAE